MISILCPTRKRLAMVHRMIQSARLTAAGKVEVVLYVDDDDADTDREFVASGVAKCVKGPRITLSDMWNKCAAAAKGSVLMQGNDDIVFRTASWDKIVEDKFAEYPDRIVMVHGKDGSHYPSGAGEFATHPFISRRWVDVLGYFTPPYFSNDYGDTWINELANSINRRVLVPILVEHMHFSLGKSQLDDTARERLARGQRDNVGNLWAQYAAERKQDAGKLRAACSGQ